MNGRSASVADRLSDNNRARDSEYQIRIEAAGSTLQGEIHHVFRHRHPNHQARRMQDSTILQ